MNKFSIKKLLKFLCKYRKMWVPVGFYMAKKTWTNQPNFVTWQIFEDIFFERIDLEFLLDGAIDF